MRKQYKVSLCTLRNYSMIPFKFKSLQSQNSCETLMASCTVMMTDESFIERTSRRGQWETQSDYGGKFLTGHFRAARCHQHQPQGETETDRRLRCQIPH